MILLDEPTNGLDPASRRRLWAVINNFKKGAPLTLGLGADEAAAAKRSPDATEDAAGVGNAILVTTHSMEEADILCDRLTIMSAGELKCIGHPNDLKDRLGNGYSLSMTAEHGHEEVAIAFVQKVLPSAELVSEIAGHYKFAVPNEDVILSKLLGEMERGKVAAHIDDYGIEQTTLEDVFMRFIDHDEHA